MASMNNWLAFSLSPQEFPPQPQTHASTAVSRLISGDSVSRSGLGFNSNEVSGGDDVSGDCFDLGSDSSAPPMSIPTLRPDGHFGILEAFNRTHQPQGQYHKTLHFNFNSQLHPYLLLVS